MTLQQLLRTFGLFLLGLSTQPVTAQTGLGQIVSDMATTLPKNIPCYQINPKTYMQFPPQVVLDDVDSHYDYTVTTATPEGAPVWKLEKKYYNYKNLVFKDIALQEYGPGEKLYMVPVFKDGNHAGWAKYLATKVTEKFDSTRASGFKYRISGKKLPNKPGSITPFMHEKCTEFGAAYNPFGVPNSTCIAWTKFITYEMCSWDGTIWAKTGTKQPEDAKIPPYNATSYNYGPNDVPAMLVNHAYKRQQYEDTMATLNASEVFLMVVASLTPGVGTTLSAGECYHSGKMSCWWGVSADAVGDVLIFAKAAKLSKLSKFNQMLSQFDNKAVVITSIGLNAAATGSAILNDDKFEAVARAAGVTGDTTVLRFFDGQLRIDTIKVPDGQCPVDIKNIQVGMNDVPLQNFCGKGAVDLNAPNPLLVALQQSRRIVEPSNTLTKEQFHEEVVKGIATRGGVFSSIQNLEVYRVDSRSPSLVLKEGGIFPNPDKFPGDIWDHVKPESGGTGSFVSTTTEKANRHILTSETFLPPAKNYTAEQIDNIDSFESFDYIPGGEQHNGPLPPPESLPEPMIFEVYEYRARTDVTVVNHVNEPVIQQEKEAVARALRIDEGDGLWVRKVTVKMPFVYVRPEFAGDEFRVRFPDPSEADQLAEITFDSEEFRRISDCH